MARYDYQTEGQSGDKSPALLLCECQGSTRNAMKKVFVFVFSALLYLLLLLF